MSITSLLVANRGEIASRVFRTARSMGMRCIAVYVDSDADAPFVSEADHSVRLTTGYLDAEVIVAAAKAAGADAIHPGYGFLSENAEFARAVTDAGLIWVGPSADVIESMGDKLTAKKLAIATSVPTLPSTDDVKSVDEVGFPLLVKASAGGGGKGMRIVENSDDLEAAIDSAKREAKAAFGDDTVFLERYIANSRHVEIQILGDLHGNLIHLGERECSIQRRHQKIIEEAPSPALDDELREAMTTAALALAKAMHYSSAGTVEFLLDEDTKEFFFLEVNTRLQVEHAVTEEVTGVDLVRAQLLIAADETLEQTQEDISFVGHAIEARLYAEDVDAGFLPATGTLVAYQTAAEPAVRWDSGVTRGSVVGVEFDPMLAKVIAHAPTRSEAAGRLALALKRMHLGGVITNRDFLAATLRSDEFLAGDTTTDFIQRVRPGRSWATTDLVTAAVIAALWRQGLNRQADDTWNHAPSGWRNARLPAQATSFSGRSHDDHTEVAYRVNRDGSFAFTNGSTAVVHRWSSTDIDVEIDGHRITSLVTQSGAQIHVQLPQGTVSFDVLPRFSVPGSETPSGGLIAPMPGKVLSLLVAEGDEVSEGQMLVVLEAMKMEHHISAPMAGTVTGVLIAAGQQLENGQLLLTIEPTESSDG